MAITIDGKEYKEEDLSPEVLGWTQSLNEILANKRRLEVEYEKVQVLTDYYQSKIVNAVKESEKPEEPAKEDTDKKEKK